MLLHIESPDFADADTALTEAVPDAVGLIEALRDCRHPRSGRLLARLRDCQNSDELDALHGEVFNLLALSFGLDEAARRVTPLQ